MKINEELQTLNNQLDKLRHELTNAEKLGQTEARLDIQNRQQKLIAKIDCIKEQKNKQTNTKGQKIQALKFHRPITKTE